MTVTNTQLLRYLDELLKPQKVKDYCPNGLQIEGAENITKVITGVTASQALIDHAIQRKAQAIFVHHGYFWRGENPCLRGMKKARFKALLLNDINLYAYHLPLDIHPELGNNAQLAKRLGISVVGGLDKSDLQSVAMQGEFAQAMSLSSVVNKVEQTLDRTPLVISGGQHKIKTVAWCTGGGQGYIEAAAEQGIDAFITGEASEQTVHTAREMNIHFIAAGHHATERYGALEVGNHLSQTFGLDVEFVDIDNPV